MPKLRRLKVKAVALVDKGANRKEFFLVKSQKGGPVRKELVIELLKAAKGLSQESVNELLALVPETERDSVRALVKASDGVADADTIEVEQLIEKVGAKFSKATSDQMKALQDTFVQMQALLTELVNGQKEADPALAPEAKVAEKAPVEMACACGEKVKAAADGEETLCQKCGAVVKAVEKSGDEVIANDPDPKLVPEEDVTPEQFDDMLNKAIAEEGLTPEEVI